MAAKKKPSPPRAAPRRKTPRKQKADSAGLEPSACVPEGGVDLGETGEAVTRAGGVLVGAYRDPLGGRPLGIAVLPVMAIEPTPFQRDLSDAHHKRLAEVIPTDLLPISQLVPRHQRQRMGVEQFPIPAHL